MKLSGENYRGLWIKVGLYSSLGLILPASALGGFGLGWLVDTGFRTDPIFSILFCMLGAGGGLVELLRLLKRFEGKKNQNVNLEN